MKITPTKLIAAACIALMAACSSGRKAYQSGDYYNASVKSVERLRSDPSNRKARETLVKAYPMAVADARRKAGINTQARDVARLEGNIVIYGDMVRLSEEIIHCPAALSLVTPEDFRNELEETKQIVGPLYYDIGTAALNGGTLESARAAYDAFVRVAKYTPGYRDVNNLLAQARYLATLRVIVTKPVVNLRYSLDADFFYNRLMSEVTRRTYQNLVRFYTPAEAAAERMNDPHHVLLLDFADFTVGNSRSTSDTKDCESGEIVIGTTTVDGQKHNVMGKVKARFTFNRLEVLSAGAMVIRITDAHTGKVLNQRSFANNSVWFSEWASFNGDERALTHAQIELTKRRPLPVPPPQELFASFANPLYAQATSFISSVYR